MQLSIDEAQAVEQVSDAEFVFIDKFDFGMPTRTCVGKGQHSQCEDKPKGCPFDGIG